MFLVRRYIRSPGREASGFFDTPEYEQKVSFNGKEYRGDTKHHAFMTLCREQRIEQRFTKVKTPRTGGKAERAIKTTGSIPEAIPRKTATRPSDVTALRARRRQRSASIPTFHGAGPSTEESSATGPL
jgi:hypothetical protein